MDLIPPSQALHESQPRFTVSMWITLDGLVAGPDHEMDWLSVAYEMLACEIDMFTTAGTLLLGRITYGNFANSWQLVAEHQDADENQRTYAL
jgi:dihydrofolate reductase